MREQSLSMGMEPTMLAQRHAHITNGGGKRRKQGCGVEGGREGLQVGKPNPNPPPGICLLLFSTGRGKSMELGLFADHPEVAAYHMR